MENLDPPPPKSRMGKWRVFALRAASSFIWGGWGFAIPFYFVQDCRSLDPARLYMFGHLFQNYDTIYVRFFATYTSDLSCFVGFFPKYVTIFFSNAHIYALLNKHVYMGVTESRRIIPSTKTPSCTVELKVTSV